jgi:hypothetical protein
MRIAIDLDDEPGSMTIEIDDVVIDSVLPSEPHSEKLVASQSRPQQLLSLRWLGSH